MVLKSCVVIDEEYSKQTGVSIILNPCVFSYSKNIISIVILSSRDINDG